LRYLGSEESCGRVGRMEGWKDSDDGDEGVL